MTLHYAVACQDDARAIGKPDLAARVPFLHAMTAKDAEGHIVAIFGWHDGAGYLVRPFAALTGHAMQHEHELREVAGRVVGLLQAKANEGVLVGDAIATDSPMRPLLEALGFAFAQTPESGEVFYLPPQPTKET